MNKITDTDVLVVGGGAAGVAACIAVSTYGLRVTMIERNGFLGGKATAAEVGTVCGLYVNGLPGNPEYVAGGVAREFAERLQQASGTEALHNHEWLYYLPYDMDAFKHTCQALLSNHQIDILSHTELISIETGDGLISRAITLSNNAERIFHVKAVIDCSGEATVSRLAKLETIHSGHYQAAAQVFTMEHVAEDNEQRLGMILMKALRKAIDEKILPAHADRLYVVQGSLKNNRVSLKAGIPLAVTYEPGNLEALRDMGLSFIHELTSFLVQHVPAFKDASLQRITPEVGTRTGARTVGKYVLTANDRLNCRKFEDGIANGSWPLEEWELDRRVKMGYLQAGGYYQVPARCLQSNFIENLYMAGRNISATDEAIASARVMGTCFQTGYAAGCLAAGNLMQTPVKETIKEIQAHQL